MNNLMKFHLSDWRTFWGFSVDFKWIFEGFWVTIWYISVELCWKIWRQFHWMHFSPVTFHLSKAARGVRVHRGRRRSNHRRNRFKKRSLKMSLINMRSIGDPCQSSSMNGSARSSPKERWRCVAIATVLRLARFTCYLFTSPDPYQVTRRTCTLTNSISMHARRQRHLAETIRY